MKQINKNIMHAQNKRSHKACKDKEINITELSLDLDSWRDNDPNLLDSCRDNDPNLLVSWGDNDPNLLDSWGDNDPNLLDS